MLEAGYGDAGYLQRFIEEHEAEIWRRLGDSWTDMHDLRREQHQ
jgi:hypothetical protein